ncbi:uncharacterized protein BX664DRAFT_294856 [Halteromyces radiatus]|uniref:uncharacterized protein n=1 Tax=Halteromyces radiatus TaxID=101107 RepID=UPI00221FAB15|nr:uncharacterized protein BX664DRAFT_294856 [Halteromyces radiatus]KAI8093239.1 hypothetical protein BX664DRAFT_294856 [Halteromyces radiatus]
MERERFDARLSKRLSGGHYGSAGGLLLSIEAAQRRSRQQQKHRQSNGISITASSPPTVQHTSLVNDELIPPVLKKDTMTTTTSTEAADNENDNNQALSKEDKERMRQKSAATLTGDGNKINKADLTSILLDQQKSTLAQRTTAQNNINISNDNTSTSKISSDHLFDDSPLTISSFWNENPNLVLNGFGPGPFSTSTSTQSTKSYESSSAQVSDSKEAKEMAEMLWNEDETIVTKNHMAEWLGTRKPLNSRVLVYYMNHFEFSTLRLDSAFRKLCGKLYFKAEAQQIDRILDVFAKRYWKCNPQSVFGSADVVYAVVYSLLLLNTDLHVAQGNYARMTKQAFVKNTMSTIYDQSSVKITKVWEINMESYLKDLYNSVKQNQILQPMSDKSNDVESVTLEKRSSIIGGRRVLEMKKNMGAIIRKSMLEPSIVLEESDPIISPVRSPSSPLSSSQQRKRDSISSIGSGASSLRNPTSLLSPSPHSPAASSYTSSHGSVFINKAPYLKEGVVVRKHLLENATQKAKHRDWRECLLVVGDGELKMYTTQGGYQQTNNKVSSSSDTDRRSVLRSSGIGFGAMTESFVSKSGPGSVYESNGNKWGAFSQLVGTISLSHSLANVLPPPGYNRQRPFVFAIQQSHGGVYLFQAGSQTQVNEWATTCNYWAARQSKEPLPGGVSNMEYGWGNCLHDVILNLDEDDLHGQEQPIGVFQQQQQQQQQHQQHQHQQHQQQLSPDIMIYEWRPPAPPMVSSSLNEKEQYEALQKHLSMLNVDINEHRDIKKKMMVKFPSKHPQYTKVMSNWESKSKYLLHEIIKYQNYCDVLEKSLSHQDHDM